MFEALKLKKQTNWYMCPFLESFRYEESYIPATYLMKREINSYIIFLGMTAIV